MKRVIIMTIDLQKISKKLGFSPEETKKWLKKFVEYSPNYLDPLYEGIKEKDFNKLALTAYKLKGSAAMLGIDELADIAERIYQGAGGEKDIDYLGLVDEVRITIREIKAAL